VKTLPTDKTKLHPVPKVKTRLHPVQRLHPIRKPLRHVCRLVTRMVSVTTVLESRRRLYKIRAGTRTWVRVSALAKAPKKTRASATTVPKSRTTVRAIIATKRATKRPIARYSLPNHVSIALSAPHVALKGSVFQISSGP